MTGYDSKYTGPSWQQIMASGLDGGDIQAPIDDPIGRPGYWSGALRSQGVGGEDDGSAPRSQESGTGNDYPSRYGSIWYFHKDHLGSSTLITNGNGFITQQIDYLPYGEVFLEKQRNANDYLSPYRFNGKELDEETGLYYYGARYMNPRLSLWMSVDPKATDAPDWTPYRFGFNNPIRYIDPDGRWEWDAARNLKSQKGDNSYTLAKFLGTNQENAMTILNRGGVSANDKGVLNLKAGQVFSKNDLWIGFKSKGGAVVNNTKEALSHYFNGKGASADVGDQSTRELLSSSEFKKKHTKITSKVVASEGHFAVDLTKSTFHIGRTTVNYKVGGNGKSSYVTYTLFWKDGFWDPDFIDENTLGRIPIIRDWTKTKPDGSGPNLERFGGTPYRYKTRERTYFFKPVEDNK